MARGLCDEPRSGTRPISRLRYKSGQRRNSFSAWDVTRSALLAW